MATKMTRAADAALRTAIGLVLSKRGFLGTLPHWYRPGADSSAWVVSVEHDRYGGGFRAELGWLPPKKLFPALQGRPRAGSGIKASDVDVIFRRSVPAGDFVRYGANPASAATKVANAVRKHVPAWFEANERIACDLTSRISVARLEKLARTTPWIALWIEHHGDHAGARQLLRRKLERARHNEDRVWLALPLARYGDKAAHRLLVELLDDLDPDVSLAAAHALATIHGWPFRWNASSVPRIKALVVRRGRSLSSPKR